jgi:transcriptional regulator with XRE-family HTH domain
MGPTDDNLTNRRVADAKSLEIAIRIRTLRIERGLTQQEFAELIGISARRVHRYEKGANHVPASRIDRIAEALHVPVTSLFGPPGKPPKTQPGSTGIGLEFLETAGALRLIRAFSRIKNPRTQRFLIEITERIAAASDQS